MGVISTIQWTDSTWNVAVGCTKVSPGCKNCYMMRDFEGRFGRADVNGTVTRTKPATFNAPLKWQKQGLRCIDGRPLKVFTSSLTDIFHPAIDSYRHEIWDIIKQCPGLVFQILTKRSERILECLPPDWGPDNYSHVWLGVSVESQQYLYRVEELAHVELVLPDNLQCSFCLFHCSVSKSCLKISGASLPARRWHRAGQLRSRAILLTLNSNKYKAIWIGLKPAPGSIAASNTFCQR